MAYEEQVGQIVNDVWESMLGASAAVAGTETAEKLKETETLSGHISISGKWNGAMTIVCAMPLAEKIAEAMFGMGPGEASESEVGDALGEVTNMIGGNFKAQMEGPNQLSLPSVVKGREYQVMTPGTVEACRMTFVAYDLPIQVTLREAKAV